MSRIPLAILTPTYNSKNLKECIDSCKHFISIPYYHIIVDDGSKDPTLIGQAYDRENESEFIKVYKLNENRGVGHARNVLLYHARRINPEYIIWVDSDDKVTYNFTDMFTTTDIYGPDITCGRFFNPKKKNLTSKPTNGLFTNREQTLIEDRFKDMSILGKLFKFDAIKNYDFPEIRYREDRVYMEAISLNKKLTSMDYEKAVYFKTRSPQRTSKQRFISREELLKYSLLNEFPQSKYIKDAK